MEQQKIIKPGIWHIEFDENENVLNFVYEDSYYELVDFEDKINDKNKEKIWLTRIHQEDQERLESHLKDCISKHPEGKDFDIEYRMMTKQGYRWFHDYGRCTRKADGSLIRCDGTIFDIDDIKNYEIQLKHEKLRSEVFEYMIGNNDDPIELFKKFAERIRILLNCDQVIYRDLKETRIMANSEEIGKDWVVPMSYCIKCQFFDIHNKIYKNGYTIMDDCQEGWNGFKVFEKCPIKSSLTRLVYCDGIVNGHLAINYVNNYHHFTKKEKSTIEDFARILSIALSRFSFKQKAVELEKVEKQKFVKPFVEKYDVVYFVNMNSDTFEAIKRKQSISKKFSGEASYSKSIKKYINELVIDEDKDRMIKECDYSVIKKKLKEKGNDIVEYRAYTNGEVCYHEMMISPTDDRNIIVVAFSSNNLEIVERKLHNISSKNYFALYEIDLDSDIIRAIKKSQWNSCIDKNLAVYSIAIKEFASFYQAEEKTFFESLSNFDYLRKVLKDDDKLTFSYIANNLKDKKGIFVSIYVLERHDDGSVATFSLGFSYMDTSGSERQLLQNNLKESLTFTNYFLNSYVSAYYINVDTHECKTYKRTQELDDDYPIYGDYYESFNEYINYSVHPEDRDELRNISNPETMKNILKNQSEYFYVFRDISNGEKMYKMQVIRGVDDKHAAFGFIDITKEMLEQEKHLLGAIPISPDILGKSSIGLWSFELDEGKPPRMYADEAMLKLIGLDHQVSPEETYHAWYDNIDEGSYGLVADAVEKMTSGEHAEVQYPWHHPDGRTFVVRCGGVRNFDYKTGIRIEGTHQDVSATVHFDIQERKNIENLVSGFANAYEAAFLVDLKQETFKVIANKNNIESRIGKISSYKIAKRAYLSRYVHPDDKYLFNSELFDEKGVKAKVAIGEIVSFEFRSNLDGEYLWRRAVFNRINENQVLIGFENCNEEVIFKHINEKIISDFASIFLVNLENNTFKFISRNSESGFANIPGGVYTDVIDEYITRVNIDYRKEWYNFRNINTLRGLLAKQNHIEYVYPLEGAKKRWRRCILQTLESRNGIPTSFVMTYLTIDDASAANLELLAKIAKQQEQLEEALANAESANNAKTEFLFNMSHDIRTPMNAILGYTDIALRHGDEPERVNDSLVKIKTAGSHLLNLINDILEMSRIEAGKLEIVEAPLDIREAIMEIDSMSKTLAISKDINFATIVQEFENNYIYADSLHINQIIINLISNAIKYTNPGGKVVYKVEQISKAIDGVAKYKFTVKDNGIGMSNEFQKHLFESFSRENSATVSKQEGAGLGLSIVKRIVELANGTISVESKKGKGSIFTVELPFKVMDEKAIEEFGGNDCEKVERDENSIFKGKKLLLVEDNEMNREIASEILIDAGFDVEEAEDGAIAVKMINKKGANYYDFILMDIQMPVMDGYEATKKIREKYPKSKLPIIALSANAFAEDKEASKEAGMNDHVAKPIKIDELLNCLRKYL